MKSVDIFGKKKYNISVSDIVFFTLKLLFKDPTFGTKYAVWNDRNNNYTYSYISSDNENIYNILLKIV